MISRYLPLAILFTFVIISEGCSSGGGTANSTPTPSPHSPATRAALEERGFQRRTFDNNADIRTEARRTVSEFVKVNLPGWDIKGMSAQAYEGNIFSIDADLEKQGKRVVITFDTRKFFSEASEPYWIAVPVNRFRQDRLHKLNDADILKQLNKAQNELDDLRSPSETETPDSNP